MSNTSQRLDDLRDVEKTHQARYLHLCDRIKTNTNGWVDELTKYAPILPVEFRIETTDLFEETGSLFGQLKECILDMANDIEEHVSIMRDLTKEVRQHD